MRYENRKESRVAPKPEPSVPQEPGYYWGKWRIAEEGTADEDVLQPSDRWEAVEVLEDFDGDRPRAAFVPGVEKPQSLENFVWLKPIRQIIPPKQEG